MDLSKEKAALADIQVKKKRSLPPKVMAERSQAEAIQDFDNEKQRARESVLRRIAKESKNSKEYNDKVSNYEKKLKQSWDEVNEASDDSVKAWQKNINNPSASMKKDLEDISAVTRGFSSKKIKKSEDYNGYASGGIVRGFGKARGAKKIKVC